VRRRSSASDLNQQHTVIGASQRRARWTFVVIDAQASTTMRGAAPDGIFRRREHVIHLGNKSQTRYDGEGFSADSNGFHHVFMHFAPDQHCEDSWNYFSRSSAKLIS
jgi:hypothetical protein